MKNSAPVHRGHLRDDLLRRVYLHHLSPTDLTIFYISSKDDMNIDTKFDRAGRREVRMIFGPIFPFQGQFRPGELGQPSPALELAPKHCECVRTDQA